MKFVLFAILAARFFLAVNRYVDPDEFAHLHWSFLLSQGALPYRNFFINFAPIYHFFLLPILLFPQSASVVLAARIWEFILYLGLVFLIYKFSKNLLAPLIFAGFPMTLDKTLEIRPDVLMTFLTLVGIILYSRSPFLSGVLIGLSFLTLQKIVFVIPAVLFILLAKRIKVLPFLVGVLLPITIFLLILTSNRLENLAFINIVNGSQAIKTGEGGFSPWLSLSPWPFVYLTAGGITIPWLVNTFLWILVPVGIFFSWKRSTFLAKFGIIYFTGGIILLFLVPTPFLQYFIPLTVFGSIFAAIVVNKLNNPVVTTLAIGILVISFFQQFQDRIGNNNKEQLQVIDDVLRISKPSDTFYDMVGSYVFRPDGYYICCNEYAKFADKLHLPLPTLRESLIAHNTKFLILDRTGKSLWLPKKEDLEFLQKNYKPSKYPKIYIRVD